MKKEYIIAAAAFFAGIALVFILTSGKSRALNVNEVASDPTAYAGKVTITGIMGAVSPQDPSVFGIMDIKELKCNTPNCNKVYLPVVYTGKAPVLGDEVRVSGSFKAQGGGYIFAADKLKVVRNHKIGG